MLETQEQEVKYNTPEISIEIQHPLPPKHNPKEVSNKIIKTKIRDFQSWLQGNHLKNLK
jgi:hypothetical protein